MLKSTKRVTIRHKGKVLKTYTARGTMGQAIQGARGLATHSMVLEGLRVFVTISDGGIVMKTFEVEDGKIYGLTE